MKKINFQQLEEGLIGISPKAGAYLAEASAFCLEANGHESGVILKISGKIEEKLQIQWNILVDEQVKRSWKDSLEATQFGAVGIAISLMLELTGYTVIERSFIGTGFDYVLGIEEIKKDGSVQLISKVRLEVSGLWKESKTNTVNQRVKQKLKQTNVSDYTNLDAYIVVVEFSTPKAKFVIK